MCVVCARVCACARACCRAANAAASGGVAAAQGPRDRERRVGWPSWLHRSLKVKSHSRYVRLRCLGFSERMG